MNLIKPKKLQMGDTIGIIAPGGAVDIDKIFLAKKYFENKGFKIKLGKNIDKVSRYLAGTDEDRLSDLHSAFLDNEVNAILCARGGYGAIRLINKIDYEIIKNNPKIFCGYSDITALSAMFLKSSGLVTFSAPMAQADFAKGVNEEVNNGVNEYTAANFFNTLSGKDVIIYPTNPKIYNAGDAQGLIFGGNLTTLASLCGIDFVPDEKFIFFAEDLNEPVYKIDRYFTQLLNINNFRKNLSAILLGDFLDVDNHDDLDNLFTEIADKLNVPVIAGYPFSHGEVKASVPVGASAKLCNGILTVKDFTV